MPGAAKVKGPALFERSEFAGPPKRTLAALDPYGGPWKSTIRDTGSNGMLIVMGLYREARLFDEGSGTRQQELFQKQILVQGQGGGGFQTTDRL
jgi:hypothetical protein